MMEKKQQHAFSAGSILHFYAFSARSLKKGRNDNEKTKETKFINNNNNIITNSFSYDGNINNI